MKKTTLIILSVLSFNIYAQNFQWVKDIGGFSANATGEAITLDASGNIYTTGTFQGVVDFDPSASTYTLASNGGSDNAVFISKSDATGNFIWAKKIGGTTFAFSHSIAVDLNGGVFITGQFNDTIDADPNAGTQNINALGMTDIFVLKLDAMGNFSWVKSFGDAYSDAGKAISVDPSGNAYITGSFSGAVDFDPGTGISNLSSGSFNSFILKLDGAGNFNWVKCLAGDISAGDGITLDTSGNVYTTGNFYGAVDFDPDAVTSDTLKSTENGSIFICKLSATGNYIWAKAVGDPMQMDYGRSIAVDNNGNIYTTGGFQGTADFDPNAGNYPMIASGLLDIFILKLNPAGNFVWAKSIGSSGNNNFGYSVALDGAGDVYLTGMFQGTADFDPGASSVVLSSAGVLNSFVLKLNAAGNFAGVKHIRSTGSCEGHGLTLDASGNIFTIGVFYGPTNFDPGASNTSLSSFGTVNHTYVLKLGSSLTGIEDAKTANINSIIIYPNPNNGNFNIVAKEKMSLNLTDNLGRVIKTLILNEENSFKENIQILSSGIYFISGQTDKASINQKIIVTQ